MKDATKCKVDSRSMQFIRPLRTAVLLHLILLPVSMKSPAVILEAASGSFKADLLIDCLPLQNIECWPLK